MGVQLKRVTGLILFGILWVERDDICAGLTFG